jgi:aminopeptidase YwaD
MNKNLFFKILPVIVVFVGAYFSVNAQQVPLGQENLVTNLDQELSGESAKRNLEYISRLHRMRGSRDYDKAIEFITSKLSDYKLESIELIKIPVDGKIMYGTQKSRANWNVNFAELWELEDQK